MSLIKLRSRVQSFSASYWLIKKTQPVVKSRLLTALLASSSISIILSPSAWANPETAVSRGAQDLMPPSAEAFFSSKVQLDAMEARSLETPQSLTNDSLPASPVDAINIAQASDTGSSDPSLAPIQLDNSPVFQRWNKEVPNVLEDIRRDPAFRTRARLGLSYFPSTFDSLGWNVGVEDVFVGRSGLTVSGDYQATFTGARKAGGGELRYYLLPLGGYFNIAPVLGYRYLETPRYVTDGLNVGAKFQLVLSRTGGADISFTQTWVNPRQSEEVGITKFSFGYALTKNLRLSTDIEKQNSRQKKDTRFGISVEWMF